LTRVKKRTGEPVGVSVREGVSDDDMCDGVFGFIRSAWGTRYHESREHEHEADEGYHGITSFEDKGRYRLGGRHRYDYIG
jgi:hypothetical protein